jgi:hypothetical protein
MDSIINGSSSIRRRWLRSVRKSIKENEQDGGRQALITTYFAPKMG